MMSISEWSRSVSTSGWWPAKGIAELTALLQGGRTIGNHDVKLALRHIGQEEQQTFRKIQDDFIEVSAKKRAVRPKSLGQQRDIAAIRTHDIVLGIGPAGTGKTYLA